MLRPTQAILRPWILRRGGTPCTLRAGSCALPSPNHPPSPAAAVHGGSPGGRPVQHGPDESARLRPQGGLPDGHAGRGKSGARARGRAGTVPGAWAGSILTPVAAESWTPAELGGGDAGHRVQTVGKRSDGLTGLQETGRLGGDMEAPAACRKGVGSGLELALALSSPRPGPTHCKLQGHPSHKSHVSGAPLRWCIMAMPRDWLNPWGPGSRHLPRRQCLSWSEQLGWRTGRRLGLPPEDRDGAGRAGVPGCRFEVCLSAGTAWPLPVSCIRPLLGAWDRQLPGAGVGASFPSFLSRGRGHLGILCPGWEINPLLTPKLGSRWL